MLGRYVAMHLKKYFNVVEINRDTLDASECNYDKLRYKLMEHGKVAQGDVIINCAGTIKPRVDELGVLNAIQVNSVFPRLLANFAEFIGAKMIHPTTDCVFTGLRDGDGYNDYNENSPHDVTDIYGRTKSLGEPANCTVIRTSIIGEEVNQGRSLVEWVKRNHDKEIPGYTNHIWNGVTCYQFAKICKEIIDGNLFWQGTRHIFSNRLTKAELVELINVIYTLHITVQPKEAAIKCDRSMSSIYEPIVSVPTLGVQIAELREVEYELYGTTHAE
jgi:dTDP-4-dehydrorhamnose reductase